VQTRLLRPDWPETALWEITPALSRSGERSEPEWDPSQLARIGKHKRVYRYEMYRWTAGVGEARQFPVSRDGHDSKADTARTMVFEVAVPPGGALMNGLAVKAPATRGVPVAARRALRVNRRRIGIWAKPVLAPLPNIAEHVVKAKGIGSFLPYWMRDS
jgi:hypothetical protein